MEQLDKKLLKEEIAMIIKLDKQYDLSDAQNARKIYTLSKQKDKFKTPAGIRFMNRLAKCAIGEGVNGKCIFCGKDTSETKFVCDTCVSKFASINKPQIEQNNTTNQVSHIANKTAEITKNVIDETSKVTKVAKEKILEQVYDENNQRIVKESADKVKAAIKEVGDKTLKQSKDDSDGIAEKRKNSCKLIFGIAVVAFIVLVIGIKNILAIFTLIAIVNLIYKHLKKQSKKRAVIVFAALLLLTGVAEYLTEGTGNNYLLLLDMSKPEVDRKYGKSTIYAQGAGITTYQYPGFRLVFVDDDRTAFEIGLKSGCESSAELFDLKLGDNVSTVESKMKKNHMEFVRVLDNQLIYKNDDYFLRIYIEGDIIYELVALENTLK